MPASAAKPKSVSLLDQQTAAISASLTLFVRNLLYVEDATAELPLRQLHVCMTLVAGPRTMSELACELRMSPSATTQIADRLERAGLVMRTSSGADRRVRCLKLTPAGLRAMKRREKVREARFAAVCERLGSAERSQVLKAFQSLQQALHALDASPSNS